MNVLIAAQEKSKKDDADKSQPKLRLSAAAVAVVVHARFHVGGLNQWLAKQALVCKSAETDECTLHSLSLRNTASVAYLVC